MPTEKLCDACKRVPRKRGRCFCPNCVAVYTHLENWDKFLNFHNINGDAVKVIVDLILSDAGRQDRSVKCTQ